MTSILDYEKTILYMDKPKKAILSINNTDKPCIIYNEFSTFKNPFNFKQINLYHAGGTFVSFPKDLVFTWTTNKTILPEMINDILNWLHDCGVEAYLDNNDVMFNGQKIFGTMSKDTHNLKYEGLFLSFTSDSEIIDIVCDKKMIKQPIGLSNFGITSEQATNLIELLIKKYRLEEVYYERITK